MRVCVGLRLEGARMAACDTHPEPLRVEEAWERLLHLEHQVRELRLLLLAEQSTADEPAQDLAPVALHVPTPAPAAHWQVVCLGVFQLRCAGREPPSCSSRRGWGILQYLLTRPGYAATRD